MPSGPNERLGPHMAFKIAHASTFEVDLRLPRVWAGAGHFGAGFFGCEHLLDAVSCGIALLLPGGGLAYSVVICAGAALSMGLSSQASSQLKTFSDLTNLPTPSTSAQNRPSSIISSSLKYLASSA